MVTAGQITINLVRQLRELERLYVIPNLYIRGNECDVYCETNSYSYEYEIKISKADFLADFKKTRKHFLLKRGERVNRFYYVVPFPANTPHDYILIGDMPKYAGLIYYSNSQFKQIKTAPILNRKKLTYNKEIKNACYSRYCHYSEKYYSEALTCLRKKK